VHLSCLTTRFPSVSADHGLAVCPSLGLMVTSVGRGLVVWKLPNTCSAPWQLQCRGTPSCNGLTLVRTVKLGVDDASPLLRCSLAFTPPSNSTRSGPLLLVSDLHHGAVHVVDVVRGAHVGYLAERWSIAGPRGVAASGAFPLAAVSAWWSGAHVVHIYQGSGHVWEHVRVIGASFNGPGAGHGQLDKPVGLRFSSDGSSICVADSGNSRVSVFQAGDGQFQRHVAVGLDCPLDVEEVEGGWLVACSGSDRVEFVQGGVGGIGPSNGGAAGTSYLGGTTIRDFSGPTTLAVVPGLGLVVRAKDYLQVFATPDVIAMGDMSALRVGWMVGVVRGMLRRRHFQPGGLVPYSVLHSLS
jgi:hypothetical protein